MPIHACVKATFTSTGTNPTCNPKMAEILFKVAIVGFPVPFSIWRKACALMPRCAANSGCVRRLILRMAATAWPTLKLAWNNRFVERFPLRLGGTSIVCFRWTFAEVCNVYLYAIQ